ncbi:MAG: hypothetical protein LBP38_02210 [Desulfovibrio sp.]|nr:hypothetical protein [Desulfovibrio sp.]
MKKNIGFSESGADMMEMMSAPLVFVHATCENNIEYVLRQAIHVNPERKIILLGDECNKHFGLFVHWCNLLDYTEGCGDFNGVYIHRSPNHACFELFCYYRWFILKNFMLRHGISVAFYSDSDMLWYDDIAVYEKAFSGVDMATGLAPALEKNFHYTVSPNFTYITLACIKRLCNYFILLYARNPNYFDAVSEMQKAEGGIPSISDMSAIGEFVKDNRETLNIVNSFEEIAEGIVDANFNSQRINRYCFDMKDGIKDIVFQNGMPTCLETEENRRYIFRALHFQGKAKRLIPSYYTAPAFELRSNLKNR